MSDPSAVDPADYPRKVLFVAGAGRSGTSTMAGLMKPIGIVVCLFAGLIVIEPDLGTTISLLAMVAGILLVSGTPIRLFALATSFAVAGGLVAIWMEPYRRERMLSFIDPFCRAARRRRRSKASASSLIDGEGLRCAIALSVSTGTTD